MERPTIAILWQDDVGLQGDAPFEREVINADYRSLTAMARDRSLDLVVGRLEWYTSSRLREAWRWEDGWTIEDDVSIDLVIDRFAFTDETARIKQQIQDETGSLNPYELKELCRDKWETYELFGAHMPETKKATPATIEAMLDQYGKAVLKPRYGAGGEGVKIIETHDEVFEPPEDYVVQQYIDLDGIGPLDIDGPHDLRVIVADGDIVLSYIRTNDEGELANIAQGGGDLVYVETDQVTSLVGDALEMVSTAFEPYQPCIYTVDFVFGPDDRPYLIELNTKPPLGFHRDIQDQDREENLLKSVLDIAEQRIVDTD